MRLPFDNRYASLPERMFARVTPALAPEPRLIALNGALAEQLGLDPAWLSGPDGLDFLAGRKIVPGSEPMAQAYAGHQFGHFVPQLGDGRAILLGEVVDRSGDRRDIQLKGAGRTPFSRGGDGRAALGPVLREYVVSEAMVALGIPTTRALAAVTTGEEIFRDGALPGAILARVASSHIRVGTFQFFAARGDVDALRLLADHAMARHYPGALNDDQPILAFLRSVVKAQASLVASWLLVGFIHGVMNTDNCAISGETIDYGPCAFMDQYDPATVFSSIDRGGRYAYANQLRIAQWNLARLAEALLPLLSDDEDSAIDMAQAALAAFVPRFDQVYRDGMNRKLGLNSAEDGDAELADGILETMQQNQVDFTRFFRLLGRAAEGEDQPVRDLFVDPAAFDRWAVGWRERLAREAAAPAQRREAMDRINPAYIPRNHRVEAMITAAVERQNFTLFEELRAVLARPFEEQAGYERFAEPPLPQERVTATFCGT